MLTIAALLGNKGNGYVSITGISILSNKRKIKYLHVHGTRSTTSNAMYHTPAIHLPSVLRPSSLLSFGISTPDFHRQQRSRMSRGVHGRGSCLVLGRNL